VSEAEEDAQQTALSGQPGSRRAELVEHVILRSQVQAALYQLVRGYEETTGLSVVRLNYEPDEQRVTIEALPRI
jgi:hypothetical protein